jgi:diguanylate cyclase (GGDEF)-like protein
MNRPDDDNNDVEEVTRVSVGKDVNGALVSERDRPYLIVLAGSNVGEMYKLTHRSMVLGRDTSATIRIVDDAISRRHAELRTETDGTVVIVDLQSRNGTLVNGRRVKSQPLSDGDKIQLGDTTILKFTYHDNLDDSFQHKMYESALRDGLTRAFNKKYFLERIDTEFRFATRHRAPLSLLMFDVDHFKTINDTYGHLAGDQVLVTIARTVHESVRQEDVFARYGGEEFAVLCRSVRPEDAAILAERLRAAVAATEFSRAGARFPVTISVGVAGLPNTPANDPIALIETADRALYTAKQSGRNCVQVSRSARGVFDDGTSATTTRVLDAVRPEKK